MNSIKFLLVFLVLLLNGISVNAAENKVVVIPSGDSFMTIAIPQPEPEPSPYLVDAFDKPVILNKGWDTRFNNKTLLDPTVNIAFKRLEPVFGYPGIIFTGQEIAKWGEQTYFPSAKKIYAKAVLLVDKGDTLEGGPFEWSLNKQGFISFHNIVRKDKQTGWIGGWTDPRRGDKVWFFIISNDEKFSSNPISFIWP